MLQLPTVPLKDLFTGHVMTPQNSRLHLSSVLADFPVALLSAEKSDGIGKHVRQERTKAPGESAEGSCRKRQNDHIGPGAISNPEDALVD